MPRLRRWLAPAETQRQHDAGLLVTKADRPFENESPMNAAIPERRPATEEISGLIERVTFHNDDGGFCVLRAVCALPSPASAEEQLKTMPVQRASGRFGGDVVEGRPACGEDTSVSA